jgi:hypothetical protein
MKANSISFPHPVLGIADDVRGFYRPEYTPSLSRDEIVLSVKHSLSNHTLEKLISEKKAFFAVELNCPQTIYRSTWNSYDKNQLIKIDSSELRNGVEVSFYIIAGQDIPNYVIDGANQDYKGYKLHISKGDVLAYDGVYKFLAEKTWASASSLDAMFDVQKSVIDEGPMEFVLTDERIIIKLSKKDYDKYVGAHRAQQYYPIIHSSMAFPALTYALNEMFQDDSVVEGHEKNCLWEEALESRINNDETLKKIGQDKKKIPEIAQILLKNPISRTLETLYVAIYKD